MANTRPAIPLETSTTATSSCSRHRRGSVGLPDASVLTIDAFDALASSRTLKSLSFVGHDLHNYGYPGQSPWGPFGDRFAHVGSRPLERYVQQLEARHGRIPWLHPVENYGSETPYLEAVVAHPVARVRT